MSRPLTVNLTGQRYGRLTVIERAPNQGRKVAWNCVCDCGNKTVVQTFDLIFGSTSSCGCYRRERAIQTHSRNQRNRPIYKLRTR